MSVIRWLYNGYPFVIPNRDFFIPTPRQRYAPYLQDFPDQDAVTHYQLSAHSEKLFQWLQRLEKRQFVGTESRFRFLFQTLRDMVEYTIAYQFGITREGRNSRSLRFFTVDERFSNQDEEKATYLMQLCKQLHLQLLVVTPSDKIQIVERFIAHVHLVQRVGNRHSVLFNMTKKELKQRRELVVNP